MSISKYGPSEKGSLASALAAPEAVPFQKGARKTTCTCAFVGAEFRLFFHHKHWEVKERWHVSVYILENDFMDFLNNEGNLHSPYKNLLFQTHASLVQAT